jgi:phosphoglycolate phosphatase-like HAD superfamily hydrolase
MNTETFPQFERRAAVIFDVDGTLCDVRDVRHHVEAPPGSYSFEPNFTRFHGDSINSPAHDEVVALAQQACADGLVVLVVTGRDESWSFLTSVWLTEHNVVYDELIMRPRRDPRSDLELKAAFALDISRRYDPKLAVDDRADIVAVWRSAGIATAQVSDEGRIGRIVDFDCIG